MNTLQTKQITDSEILEHALELAQEVRSRALAIYDPAEAIRFAHDVKALKDRISKLQMDEARKRQIDLEWAMAWLDTSRHAGKQIEAGQEAGTIATSGDAKTQRGSKLLLRDLEVDKFTASRWQRLAELDDEDWRTWEQDCRDAEKQPTLGGALAVWRLIHGDGTVGGPLYVDNEGVEFGFWALSRPLTRTWGSGDVWARMCAELEETPDAAFGRTDQIPGRIKAVDRKTGYEWASLPFKDNEFRFGYWDPPYDHLYKAEAQEIWRTCRKLAILHTHVYPRAWLEAAKRKGMYAITMGPMKQMRCLQVFDKATPSSLM